LTSVFLHLYAIAIFIQIIRTIKLENQMFKYFLVGSINDLLIFLRETFRALYFCKYCISSKLKSFWFIYCFIYLEYSFSFASSWMQVLATLNFYCLIKNKYKLLITKKFFIIAVLFVEIYSLVYYMTFIFCYEIAEKTSFLNNSIETTYEVISTPFESSQFMKLITIFHMFQRDVGVMIILFVLNLFILNFYSKMMRQKTVLMNLQQRSSMNNMNRVLTNVERVVKNQRITICVVSINYFFGHLGIFVMTTLLYLVSLSYSNFLKCLEEFSIIFFIFSHSTNIFLIYCFNKHFRSLANQNIKKLIKFVTKRN
jgi:hypothetical protein